MLGKLGITVKDKPTTRPDVALALVGAFYACFKAWDTTTKYKAEQKAQKDKEITS